MKDEGGNRQDTKVSEEDSPWTHAALTGICRSGGSVDTLTGKLIRLSGCQPIQVRVADSTACHSSHLISPIKSALIGVNLRFHSSVSFLAFLGG